MSQQPDRTTATLAFPPTTVAFAQEVHRLVAARRPDALTLVRCDGMLFASGAAAILVADKFGHDVHHAPGQCPITATPELDGRTVQTLLALGVERVVVVDVPRDRKSLEDLTRED